MRKSIEKPKVRRKKTDRMKFAVLRERIIKLGLHEVPPDAPIKFMIEEDKAPPPSERISDTFDQLSYKRKINGLTIKVHTSFNPTLTGNEKRKANGLYAKKGGAFWIIILDENGKRIFTRKRFRTPSAIDRIPQEVEFLINRLKHRPEFPAGKRRKVKATIQVKKEVTYWVSPESNALRQQFFMFNVPEHLKKFIKSLEYSRKYYREYVRDRLGVKRTENEIRKPWAIPVGDVVSK